MARKLRVQFEGAIYHVTIRGVDRRKLFDDDDDRARFLKRLGEAVEEYGIRLYLYCLMKNHVHLLVETPQANLSAFMHKIQTAYTVYYNLRHKRAGHLMQGRFGAKPVDGDEYLLKFSRYIHLNPVYIAPLKGQPLERRLAELRAYSWSSYRGYAGLSKSMDFVEEGPILAMLEKAKRKQRRSYRRFVEAGIAKSDEEFLDILRESAWGIGGSDFQERIRDRHTDMASKVNRPEDVSFRQATRTISPDAILDHVARAFDLKTHALRQRHYDCVARAVAAQALGRYAGMNQRDIGGFLGMGSGSAVSLQVKRLRERRTRDLELDARIERLVGNFETARNSHENR